MPSAAGGVRQVGVEFKPQCRADTGRGDEGLRPTPGANGDERQWIVRPGCRVGAEHEGALTHRCLGLFEEVVDGIHQGPGRAMVGRQDVVAAFGGPPRPEIAVDVGPTKAVDRLLRIANQQQSACRVVVLDAVELVEDPHLLR